MRYGIDELQAMGLNTGCVEVLLDGKLQRDPGVIAFDPDEGFIEVYRRDEAGKAVIENDKYVVDTLRGKVEGFLIFGTRRDGDRGVPYWPHGTPEPAAGVQRVLIQSIRR